MKKLLPVLLLVIGLAGGGGAGWLLRPPAPAESAQGVAETAHAETAVETVSAGPTETIRLPNQFVVPLIEDGQVRAMVVIGLALELTQGHDFVLADGEARVRAVFLQRLFDHANIGGFDGLFTSGEALLALRRTLREAGRTLVGPGLHDVLITELLRQES